MRDADHLIRIKGRIAASALSFKLKDYQIDDIYQDYCLHILSGHGKHQTINQFMIDWIRHDCGRKGHRKLIYIKSIKVRNKGQRIEKDEVALGEQAGIESPEYTLLVKQLYEHLPTNYQRQVFVMAFIKNFAPSFIAKLLNKSRNGISTTITSIRRQCMELLSRNEKIPRPFPRK